MLVWQNKSELKIWNLLELNCYSELNMQYWHKENLTCLIEIWFYFSFNYSYKDGIANRYGNNKPIQWWYPSPTFVDNKGEPRVPEMIFIYVYRIDINIEQLISFSNKHNLQLHLGQFFLQLSIGLFLLMLLT